MTLPVQCKKLAIWIHSELPLFFLLGKPAWEAAYQATLIFKDNQSADHSPHGAWHEGNFLLQEALKIMTRQEYIFSSRETETLNFLDSLAQERQSGTAGYCPMNFCFSSSKQMFFFYGFSCSVLEIIAFLSTVGAPNNSITARSGGNRPSIDGRQRWFFAWRRSTQHMPDSAGTRLATWLASYRIALALLLDWPVIG